MVLALVAACTAVTPVMAEATRLDRWFDTFPEAAPYRSELQNLEAIFSAAEQSGIPEEVLFDKLREGMAKHVPPARLTAAIAGEAERGKAILDLIARGAGRVAGPADALVRSGSILLQNGVSLDAIGSVVATAGTAGKTADRALAACAAAFQTVTVAEASMTSVPGLARALVLSTWPEQSFASLVSAATRSRSAGYGGGRFITQVQDLLNRGASMQAIDRELLGRGRGR